MKSSTKLALFAGGVIAAVGVYSLVSKPSVASSSPTGGRVYKGFTLNCCQNIGGVAWVGTVDTFQNGAKTTLQATGSDPIKTITALTRLVDGFGPGVKPA